MNSIDIVIPVYNEGDNIIPVLNAFQEQVKSPIRVLICYDFDDDTTLAAINSAGVFVSNVSTGTAPFTVASTTPVANLNIGGNAANVTGIVGIANGGTNSSNGLNNNRIMVSSGGSIVESAALTDGQILIGSTGAAPTAATITAGTGMTVTNAAGGITVAANVANAIVSSNRTTTSTTLSDVTDMSFSIGANETWSFEFHISNGCSGNGGTDWAVTVPSGGTLRASVLGRAGAYTDVISTVLTSSGSKTFTSFNTANSAYGNTHITGVVVNGATPGNVTLQFSAGTGGQTSTVFANSYLTARKVE